MADRDYRQRLPSLLAEVRQARAILTPEVLRLIEAGREYQNSVRRPGASPIAEGIVRMHDVLEAALALPFEKPAEPNHTEKQQLPKKGGE